MCQQSLNLCWCLISFTNSIVPVPLCPRLVKNKSKIYLRMSVRPSRAVQSKIIFGRRYFTFDQSFDCLCESEDFDALTVRYYIMCQHLKRHALCVSDRLDQYQQQQQQQLCHRSRRRSRHRYQLQYPQQKMSYTQIACIRSDRCATEGYVKTRSSTRTQAPAREVNTIHNIVMVAQVKIQRILILRAIMTTTAISTTSSANLKLLHADAETSSGMRATILSSTR